MGTCFALRAARRQPNALTWQLRQGLSDIESIARVATLLGLLGACWSFASWLHQPPAYGRPYAESVLARVHQTLWWPLAGLAFGVTSGFAARLLRARCRQLEDEIDSAVRELPAQLRPLGAPPIPAPPPPRAIHFAERAAHRARRTQTQRLGRPLASLATVSSVGLFVGMAGTCVWLGFYSFKGGSFGPNTARALFHSLGESLLFAVAGLLLAIAATWAGARLETRREALDQEMRIAILDLSLALKRL